VSHKEIIKQILSDGRWHCIQSIIIETGHSARNRISEMNIASEKANGKLAIEGAPCDIEGHSHKANLFKYRNAQHDEKEYYLQTFDELIGESIT
tara:strand:- start:1555 stop:1836 length:282 start_codon:yes stop_codon:yes gene_type:complete